MGLWNTSEKSVKKLLLKLLDGMSSSQKPSQSIEVSTMDSIWIPFILACMLLLSLLFSPTFSLVFTMSMSKEQKDFHVRRMIYTFHSVVEMVI